MYDAEHAELRGLARAGEKVTLSAVVVQRPRPVHVDGYAGRPGGARSVLVPVDAVTVTVGGERVAAQHRVLLIAPAVTWSVGSDQNDALRYTIAIVAALIVVGAVWFSKRRSTAIGDDEPIRQDAAV